MQWSLHAFETFSLYFNFPFAHIVPRHLACLPWTTGVQTFVSHLNKTKQNNNFIKCTMFEITFEHHFLEFSYNKFDIKNIMCVPIAENAPVANLPTCPVGQYPITSAMISL